MPWRYVDFLEYAAERLFLRKVGSGYSFIHRQLQDHFAAHAALHADSPSMPDRRKVLTGMVAATVIGVIGDRRCQAASVLMGHVDPMRAWAAGALESNCQWPGPVGYPGPADSRLKVVYVGNPAWYAHLTPLLWVYRCIMMSPRGHSAFLLCCDDPLLAFQVLQRWTWHDAPCMYAA